MLCITKYWLNSHQSMNTPQFHIYTKPLSLWQFQKMTQRVWSRLVYLELVVVLDHGFFCFVCEGETKCLSYCCMTNANVDGIWHVWFYPYWLWHNMICRLMSCYVFGQMLKIFVRQNQWYSWCQLYHMNWWGATHKLQKAQNIDWWWI